MADIIDFDGGRLSLTPEFKAQSDAAKACIALADHFAGALLTPAQAAEAWETIRRAMPLAEPTA